MGSLRLRAVIHPSFRVTQTAESPTFQFTPSDNGVKAWSLGINPWVQLAVFARQPDGLVLGAHVQPREASHCHARLLVPWAILPLLTCRLGSSFSACWVQDLHVSSFFWHQAPL